MARAIHRVMRSHARPRDRGAEAGPSGPSVGHVDWPPILEAQLPRLPELLRTLGLHVIEAPDEVHLVASYAAAALAQGDDVIVNYGFCKLAAS